ncbi:hypothetical protein A3860_38730 [Niastella vici]|uniref:Amidohydrolase-related domain-containing protein n=1 Tax=Niastella vici TaxID=1703345 RepID=A0A1V9FLC7_9BACT|nr:amidohydrolase family protein [Niastella vici]OQP59107.1 hypothetical protein A3860_38730 [Niastella vici]
MKYLFAFFLILNLTYSKGQKLMVNSIPRPFKGVQTQKQLITDNFYSKDYSLLPVKPKRTFTLTTNEGSSMDVDVSPDGNNILFTLLGELFLISSKGGEAIQLSRGMAINTYPVWSPNGKLIAYVTDGSGEKHVHVRDLSGKYHKILGRNEVGLWFDWFPPSERKVEPIWLPEGENIVSDLNVYHLSGFKKKLPDALIRTNSTYLSPEFNYNTIIGFTNDRRYIFFEDNETIKRYDRKRSIDTVIIKNRKDDPENILSRENNVRVSPNGHWLTYIKKSKNTCSSDSLVLYDINDSTRKSLVSVQTKNSGRIYERHYSFSSDSKYIYIGFGGKIHRIDVQSKRDDVINFNATVKVDMAPLVRNNFPLSQDSLEVKYTRSANANPNGTKLVFSALGSIYIQDLPTGIPVKFVNQSGLQFHPIFSPDGQWIAYVSEDDYDGNGNVWRVSVSGGEPQKVSSVAGHYCNPAWSPDGKYIVVVRGDGSVGELSNGDRAQIQILSVNDGGMKVLADKVPFYNMPSFSPDGHKIFFVPKQEGLGVRLKSDPKFVYVDLNDTGYTQRVLASGGTLSGTGVDTYSKQMIISPDEQYLIYTDADDLCLVPFANLGYPILIHDTIYGSENGRLPAIRLVRGAYDPHWENGGKILSWSFGNKYYRANVAKIIEACLQTDLENTPKDTRLAFVPTNVIDVPIIADQEIPIHLKEPLYHGRGTIALKNARIVTMGAAKVIEKGIALIRDGRLIAVGENRNVKIPADAKVLDFEGKTIIPGLIDIHTHAAPRSDMFPLLHDPWLALFAYGVTTIRDPAGSINELGFAELTETGKTTGPRVFSVGHAIYIATDQRNVTSLNSAQILVNNLERLGAIGIKQYTLPTRLQKQWLLMASQQAKVNMTNEGGRLPLEYIGMIKDGSPGVEHIPVFGDAYKDLIGFLAASGTYITPTLQVAWGKHNEQACEYFRRQYLLPTPKMKAIMSDASYQQLQKKYIRFYSNLDSIAPLQCSGLLENFKLVASIRKAGGKIALGSHTEDLGIGAHFELWALQMGGLSNYEALQIATIESAKALGMEKDLGSIDVGKVADLVILDKNPLEDIHNSISIKYVMKDGVLYDGNTLDMIWPIKKKLRILSSNDVN